MREESIRSRNTVLEHNCLRNGRMWLQCPGVRFLCTQSASHHATFRVTTKALWRMHLVATPWRGLMQTQRGHPSRGAFRQAYHEVV